MTRPGAQTTTSTMVPPIIDLAAVDDAELVTAIDRACLDTGFFVLVGHGLDEPMSALFAEARRWFSEPSTIKEQIPRVERYGFVPYLPWAVDPDRASPNTEYLDLGLADEVPLEGFASLAAAVDAYQRAALRLALRLLEAVAGALRAEADAFTSHMHDPQCRLRLLHYPAVEPSPDGVLPVPTTPHTDYGALTLLATDGVPGLEVRPLDGSWAPVVAPAGSLVVNLGDMLARWTNDRYRSTPHRVVGPATGERFSIPFFVNPHPDTTVDCLDVCVDDAHPRRYEPVTAGAFLRQRIDEGFEPYVDPGEGPLRMAP